MRHLSIFLGSPRARGNGTRLAEALAEGAREAGFEAAFLRLADLNLKGCTDCRRCWKQVRPCVLTDDIDRVYGALEEGDVLAFVSPVYFWSWSTQIKPLFDRLIPYCAEGAPRSLAGKRTLLLGTAGDDDPEVFEGMRFSYESICAYMHWTSAGTLLAHGVYAPGDVEKGDWIGRARALGQGLGAGDRSAG